MARLALAFLGPLQVALDGQPITGLTYDKVRALLAYLVMEAGRSHRRDWLAELLWPGQPVGVARGNLRQALATLRQAIGDHTASPAFLHVTRETLQFNAASDHLLDLATFTELLGAVRQHPHPDGALCSDCQGRLEAAATLYRGSFLDGIVVRDSVAFEEWVLLKRQMLRELALEALSTLAEAHDRQGAYADARRLAWRQLELDPLREAAHRQLMRALSLDGERSAALNQYEHCRRVLGEELGVEPADETTRLYDQIRAGTLASARQAHPSSLPAPITPIIGRSEELATLTRYITDQGVRLLTLAGPSGIGKTRLALDAAIALVPAFVDGVFFVDLTPLREARFVPQAIAQALQLTEAPPQSLLDTIKEHLRGKQMLLVVDNFEQVLPAATILSDLLRTAGRLQVVVTSRAPLRLYGEHVFPVPPLAVPDLAQPANAADLARVAAVRLFTARTRAVNPDFDVTVANAAAVAELCVRLDGLPLAIELAAARGRLFGAQVLLARMTRRLDLLAGGPRDHSRRQQTLRGALDWSYDLLDRADQTYFRRLSVFVGGFTLEAAEAVCAALEQVPDDEQAYASGYAVHHGLSTLLDNSLIRHHPESTRGAGGEPRFGMLETIRDYALATLEAHGERGEIQRRHADYYLALARQGEPGLSGPLQSVWLERLAAEHDNFRGALRWSLDHDELLTGVQLAGHLWWFWYIHGDLSEGRAWLEPIVAASTGLEAADRVKAVLGAGVLAHLQADYSTATGLLEEALALNRMLENPVGISATLNNLALVAFDQNNYARARALFEENLALTRTLGEGRRIANALGGLATLLQVEGDLVRAQALYAEALDHARELGDERSMAVYLGGLGWVALDLGDVDRAEALLRQDLALREKLGLQVGIANGLEGLARAAGMTGDPTRAARLWAAAELLREQLGTPLPPVEQGTYARDLADARARLDALSWTHAWAEGRTMTLDQVLAYARSHRPSG